MKKLILAFILLSTVTINAQGFNEETEFIKENYPEVYSEILTLAVNEWGDNYSMSIFEVNRQSESFIKLAKLTIRDDYDEEIMEYALDEWIKVVDGVTVCDYAAVLFTYKKQLNSKKVLQ